jgi:hypothetical protein
MDWQKELEALAECGRGELFPGVQHESGFITGLCAVGNQHSGAGEHDKLRRHQRHRSRTILLPRGGGKLKQAPDFQQKLTKKNQEESHYGLAKT